MKNRIRLMALVLVLVLVLTVACSTGTSPSATTGEERTAEETKTETKEKEKPGIGPTKGKRALKSEEELGIKHPIRFATGTRIISSEDALIEKSYEVPVRLDDRHRLVLAEPLAKGKLMALRYQVEKGDDFAMVEQMEGYIPDAIGYYDLEKGELVTVAEVGKGAVQTFEDMRALSLYPLDEGHFLYENFTEDKLEYSVYTVKDGSLKTIATYHFGPDEVLYYAAPPYTTGDMFYLFELVSEDSLIVHAYDAKTYEELWAKEGGQVNLPFQGDVVSTKEYMDADEHWWRELYLGDDIFTWDENDGEILTEFGVGTDPDGVYTLSRYENTDALEEDLTEEDKKSDLIVPYYAVHRLPQVDEIAKMRGELLTMQVSGPWMLLARSMWGEEEVSRPIYLVTPGKHEAIRIESGTSVYNAELLSFDRYLVVHDVTPVEAKTTTIRTYEPREK